MKHAVTQFTACDFRDFLKSIGIETRIGSSGKVFPLEHIKPIQVLNAWITSLEMNTDIQANTRLIDWNEESVFLEQNGNKLAVNYDYLVFAMGGKSWSKTGSDGLWFDLFQQKGLSVLPFQSSNSGVELNTEWLYEIPGTILKNVVCTCDQLVCAGDVVLTEYGMEGKPIYALNAAIRNQENKHLVIDFKPQFSSEQIVDVLKKYSKTTEALKALKLSKVAIFWLKKGLSKSEFLDLEMLSQAIKAFHLPLVGFRPIEEVISTVGGLDTDELDANGFLKAFPKVACCGEMLNWDAPTGGYLIQGCVASGVLVGKSIQQFIDQSEED